jgi:hypothetical protein
MDPSRFDAVARALWAGASRRGLLRRLAGGLLVTSALGLTPLESAAKKKGKKKKAKTSAPQAPCPACPAPTPAASCTCGPNQTCVAGACCTR